MKRALVTGGSGSLGRAIVRRLASVGHHVVIHAHQGIDIGRALADELTQLGASAEAVQFDIVDPVATEAALIRLLADGPIQILVNNAGVHDDAVMPGMARQQWSRVLDVSLNGFFNVTQPLLLPMIRTRWGRIVSLSSVSAIAGNRGQVNYAAAKAGLHGATRSLALELATRGITVNAVAPGIIASPSTEQAFPRDAVERLVPMKRVGQPEEVAELVAFLASDGAAYISGQVISINGGMI
ncbi:3-oxoacyl-ACP reductase FabG [Rhodopila sp.]|uniref:3-oxoacyl-ACP reductase FabG n=1 Tax=Rhodopila sp. TaxID=2480087 RepID=UPI003D105C06